MKSFFGFFRRLFQRETSFLPTAVYPESHEVALSRVMRCIDIIAIQPEIDDDEIVADLVKDGVAPIDARLIVLFVPIAFAFALLKQMGAGTLPSVYSVQKNSGQWVQISLAREHYFSTALAVGFDVTTQGYNDRISQETMTAISSRSAEMDSVNQYFHSGGTREGLVDCTIGAPALINISYEEIMQVR